MNINEIGWEGVDLINLAQDSEKWRALLKTIMNLRFLWKAGNSLT